MDAPPIEPAPPAPISFDHREERIIGGLARWMALLGRFQVVASTFILVILLAVAGLFSAARAFTGVSGEAADPPLVSIGEVSSTTLLAIVGAIVVFSLVFFRSGSSLISAAEDLEAIVVTDDEDLRHLKAGLRKLRNYFIIEALSILALGIALGLGAVPELFGPT